MLDLKPIADLCYVKTNVDLMDFKTLDLNYHVLRCLKSLRKKGLKDRWQDNITFNDKIKWLTIYNCTKQKILCTDRIHLHDYCKEVLNKDICVPIQQTYCDAFDIEKHNDDKPVMLKCTHGCKFNMFYSKASNLSFIQDIFNKYMLIDYSLKNGELHYHFIERKIIAEELISMSPSNYNFLCFNGNPMFIHYGYYDKNNYYMRLLDLDFKKVYYMGSSKFEGSKPKFIDEMVEYAKELSKPFKFVRVDMYYENNRVYLGEMSFSPAACNMHFVSEEKDVEFGSFLNIDPDK